MELFRNRPLKQKFILISLLTTTIAMLVAGGLMFASEFVADRESKSISRETTFERNTHDRAFLALTLRGFLRELAHDLRQEGLAAGGCAVKLKDARFTITTKHGRFPHPLNYDPDMWPVVQRALNDLLKPGTDYRLAGLTLTAHIQVWSIFVLAAGFGGLHILFGTIITVKYGG